MIVYVESNFVLELALGQEQSASAESILQSAEKLDLVLALPDFSISEPFATTTQRGRQRRKLYRQLQYELRQLGRSQPHRQLVTQLDLTPVMLAEVEKTEMDLLESTISRLLAVAHIVHLDTVIFRNALQYRATYDLAIQDAVIYACVISDLGQRPAAETKCFVSRNWKDFEDPGLRDELRGFQCEFVESFDAAWQFITKK
jgi:predicted nucleic acid-binding protein